MTHSKKDELYFQLYEETLCKNPHFQDSRADFQSWPGGGAADPQTELLKGQQPSSVHQDGAAEVSGALILLIYWSSSTACAVKNVIY